MMRRMLGGRLVFVRELCVGPALQARSGKKSKLRIEDDLSITYISVVEAGE